MISRIIYFAFLLGSFKIHAQNIFTRPYISAFGVTLQKDTVKVGEHLKFKIIVADSSKYKKVRVTGRRCFDIYFEKTYSNVSNIVDSASFPAEAVGMCSLDIELLDANDKTLNVKVASFELIQYKALKKTPKQKVKILNETLYLENLGPHIAFETNYSGKGYIFHQSTAIDSFYFEDYYTNIQSIKTLSNQELTIKLGKKEKKISSNLLKNILVSYKIEKDSTFFYFTPKFRNIGYHKSELIKNNGMFELDILDVNRKRLVFFLKNNVSNEISFSNDSFAIGELFLSITEHFGKYHFFKFLNGGGQTVFTKEEAATLFNILHYRGKQTEISIDDLNKYLFYNY